MNRDIEDIQSDLDEAIAAYNAECEEIEFHKANKDDAASAIEEYSAELEEAKMCLLSSGRKTNS